MHFKKWFSQQSLNEGVSVLIDMPTRPQRPIENVQDLCYQLYEKFYKEIPSIPNNAFDPDGNDFDKKEGLVNFYPKNLDEPLIQFILNNIIKKAEECNATIQPNPITNTYNDYIKTQKSKDPRTNVKKLEKYFKDLGFPNLDKIRVYRFKATVKPQEIDDKMPEINMGFDTARIIFEEIFGLPPAGTNPLHIATQAIAGEESEDSEEYKGYSFTADHIINVYERLKGIKNAANEKVYVSKRKNGQNTSSEITYQEFLAIKPSGEEPASEIDNENGNFKIDKEKTLPPGNYDMYYFNNTAYCVKKKQDTGDLEIIAGMEQIPPSTTKKTIGQEDEYGIFQDSPYQDQPKRKITFKDYGVNKDLILQRVEEVYKLALWAKRHGHNNMFVA